MTRAFITGGAGFIGSRLARQLAEAGTRVVVYDNFLAQVHDGNPGNRDRLAASEVQVVTGDVRDGDALAAAMIAAAPDVVYHLAAETGTGQSHDLPVRYAEVNVTGTAQLIEATRRCRTQVGRVILAGSRAVYGEGACVDTDGRPVPAVARRAEDMAAGDFTPKDRHGQALVPVPTNADCPLAPTSIYASTKMMQEYLLSQAFWGGDTDVGLLRLQNVFGPGQSLSNPYTGVLSIFARQIAEGRTLEIYEDGQITRDFVLVDDVVSAFEAMARVDDPGSGAIDIGTGRGITILDVARHMLTLMDADPDRVRITGNFRPGDIRHAVADIAAARTLLGWQPEHDFETGCARLVDWSRDLVPPTTGAVG